MFAVLHAGFAHVHVPVCQLQRCLVRREGGSDAVLQLNSMALHSASFLLEKY